MTVRGRLVWTAIFGAAFGWVEAAVVVYLRRIVYPDGFALPLAPIDPSLAVVELVREAATLAMLAAVAMLAGRTRWQRFAAFIVAFGVWDLVYYLGLKLALDWPASLATWDVLFLLPWPWLGPVYAPATVALLMVIFGSLVMLEEEVRPRRADVLAWLLGAAGALVLLVTWLYDLDAGLRQAEPAPYPWPWFVVGCALLVGCGVRFLTRRPVNPEPPPARSR
ncbi:hypothetical protein GF314_15085 [bacterium]|nr:hypothetical protein [bacterium]